MYKCKYCDSIFQEFTTKCPNCGGNDWLVNKASTEEVQDIQPEVVQNEEVSEESNVNIPIFHILFYGALIFGILSFLFKYLVNLLIVLR